MLIGKAGSAATSISTADAASITVRGRDLTSDLMGRLSFTDYFHLLVTGREPTEKQRFFLDLLLVAIAEHGLVPTNQAARMTYAAEPGALQAAVAAGILGCGSVILGTTELCGRFLAEARGRDLREMVAGIRAAGGKVPGFGHPLHKPVDPRAERILALADERGAAGAHVALARASVPLVAEIWGRPLPMNVSMPIAAVAGVTARGTT
jgi:citrate synthase